VSWLHVHNLSEYRTAPRVNEVGRYNPRRKRVFQHEVLILAEGVAYERFGVGVDVAASAGAGEVFSTEDCFPHAIVFATRDKGAGALSRARHVISDRYLHIGTMTGWLARWLVVD
jgi:hypothetical protein